MKRPIRTEFYTDPVTGIRTRTDYDAISGELVSPCQVVSVKEEHPYQLREEGRQEVYRRIATLPSPIVRNTSGDYTCIWCRHVWPFANGEAHPEADCVRFHAEHAP